MNKQRRILIERIKSGVGETIESLYALQEATEDLANEEEESRENLPESLQASERYNAMCEATDNLVDASSIFIDAIDLLETIKERLDDAKNVG